MDSKTIGVIVVAIVVVLAIAVVASRGTGPSGGQGAVQVTLQGEGSTFLYPQIQAWANDIHEMNSSIVINYNPTGSGAGQSSFLQGVVDFAGSDPPLSTQVWQQHHGEVLQMPVVIGMVVVAYNVPGIDNLNLTGEILAKIYKGDIEYWDDPLIASVNPSANLPHEQIIVIHRSDSSGTTEIFTTYLYKAAPGFWSQDLVGKTIDWPVDASGRGIGGKGNQGVTQAIIGNQYSIGYVEFAYALKNNLRVAALQNSEGNFVMPSPETAQAAALGALSAAPNTPEGDWSQAFDAIIYAPGQDSYPLTSWSFLFFYKTYSSPSKAAAVKEFIAYINGEGQNHIIQGYVPIPDEIRNINLQALNLISTG